MSPWSKHGQRSRSSQPPYPAPTREQEIVAQMAQFRKVYDKTVETLEIIKKEKENMSDFEYTEALPNSNSTAVKAAYYNVDDKTLLVVMRENGNAYRYDGVPSWVWADFKRSSSLGHFFATTLKRSYGPAKYLGTGNRLSIVQKGAVASVTPLPKRTHEHYSLGTAPAPRAVVGTPKGLTLASDAKVTTKAEAFPLTVAPAPAQGVLKATTSVLFEAFGADKTVAFDDKSTVDEALVEFNRIANAMGVSAKVKAVTVHFE